LLAIASLKLFAINIEGYVYFSTTYFKHNPKTSIIRLRYSVS
jgi:hypothetical protein